VLRRRTTTTAVVASVAGIVLLAGGASAYSRHGSDGHERAVQPIAAAAAATPTAVQARHRPQRPSPSTTPATTAPTTVAPTPTVVATPSTDVPTTATSGPVTTTSAPAASSAFKGVANSACSDLDRLSASWFYNWTTSTDCAGHGFVPMVAGKSEKTTASVTSAVERIAKAGYTSVLGFNEPNKTDQANLTVDQVVSLWPALTSDPDLAVGSPATSADTAGQAWFTSFMQQVEAQKLRVDFIAVHWYGWNAGSCDANAAGLESYLKWVESKAGGRPIWLTEWGCMNQSNPDQATVSAFYQGAVKMFARHAQIKRYAWYPWNTNNNLVADDGTLTEVGKAFAQAASTS